ncbi:MAG: DUF1571 domain-containing protein [Deltaproteobacteria bacterium]|nr:DUF1571 domain-containing protein [Deltaproteobacteria bacterium]
MKNSLEKSRNMLCGLHDFVQENCKKYQKLLFHEALSNFYDTVINCVRARYLMPLAALALLIPSMVLAEGEKPKDNAEPTKESLEKTNPDKFALELIGKVKKAGEALRDYTMIMKKQELFGKKMAPMETLQIKWARPHKLYLKNIKEPYKDREVLFVLGRHNNELTAHPGSFPDITVHLDPHGSMAMKNNHHPVDEASLVNFTRLLWNNVSLAQKRKEGSVKFLGEEKIFGRNAYKLELTAPKGGVFYTMKKGETLWDVAKKFKTSMYQILHHNADKGWDEPDDPDAGDKVFVPRYYASKIILWIDKELMLPIKALIYDHHGKLYENYEHRQLKINVGLTAKDFDPDNKKYDF